jgi:hypothetical protein
MKWRNGKYELKTKLSNFFLNVGNLKKVMWSFKVCILTIFSIPENGSGDTWKPRPRQKLREESLSSFELIKQKNMDGLLIACKQVNKSQFYLRFRFISICFHFDWKQYSIRKFSNDKGYHSLNSM